MAGKRPGAIQNKSDGLSSFSESWLLPWIPQDGAYHPGGLFASVGQMGVGFGISPPPSNPRDNGLKIPCTDLYLKYVSPETGYRLVEVPQPIHVETTEVVKKRKKKEFKIKLKIANPSLRRLFSGGVAGAVSRTAVAPLETIRTHLMVGSNGNSTAEVFGNIMKLEGWTGLFRGNLVNVIRVAPSKAIEAEFHLTSMKEDLDEYSATW